MATDLEIRKNQKAFLFDLMQAQSGQRTLQELILKMRAEMEPEDFAYIQKLVEENTPPN